MNTDSDDIENIFWFKKDLSDFFNILNFFWSTFSYVKMYYLLTTPKPKSLHSLQSLELGCICKASDLNSFGKPLSVLWPCDKFLLLLLFFFWISGTAFCWRNMADNPK